MYKNYDDIMRAAREEGKTKRIVVAGAGGTAVLGAMYRAAEEGLIKPVLVGKRKKCEEIFRNKIY